MNKINYIIIALLLILVIANIIIIISFKKKNNQEKIEELEEKIKNYIDKNQKDTLDFMSRQVESTTKANRSAQANIANIEALRFNEFSDRINESINTLRRTVNDGTKDLDLRFASFQKQSNIQMDVIRKTMEQRMFEMQLSNEKKLEEMRRTVDEKLQKTLEDRISQSFKLVSDRLEQVYKSLGEMQKVGDGIDDLRRVLSNVKTRGILGEVQLGAILEDILTPEQYETNVITKKGSNDRVEFAIKMPGIGDEPVYLPIDSKFPVDAYQKLLDAYDTADVAQVQVAIKELKARIKAFAKDISTKYIDVPNTTEFAIMFLPTEGLYSEVVRCGLVEELRKDKINIAGPTTMAALLNSLQMGFRTLAIQKTSGQVWRVLEEVKTEFSKFGEVLKKTQDRMRMASEELDKLVGTRTNAINRKLRDVATLPSEDENIDTITNTVL